MKVTENSTTNGGFLNILNSKLEFLITKTMLPLLIIGIIALFFRLSFMPNLPITFDSLTYFHYANDLIILGTLPPIQLENGWPLFTSIFFSVIQLNNVFDYMILQRILSILISVLTIIPIYLLCTRFFEKPYALMGAAVFVFEPHIIQNSLLGISEPLFIFLGSSALFLFLSSEIRSIYASFALLALCTIVRTQGIILFFILSLIFLGYNRKNKRMLLQYLVLLGIFALILTPVMFLRQETLGKDLLISSSVGPVTSFVTNDIGSHDRISLIFDGIDMLARQIGKSMIPYFGVFLPFGLLLIFKERNYKNLTIIISIIIGLVASVYILAFSKDLRYILWLYPFFVITSVNTINYISRRIPLRNIFLIFLTVGLLMLSGFFLFSTDDGNLQTDALNIAKYVRENTSVINSATIVSEYIKSLSFLQINEFPTSSGSISSTPKIITLYANTVDEYIELGKKEGLTHLVIDANNHRTFPLDDVFYNPKKYPYLIEIFDSVDNNFKNYHVKIFRIDYEKFPSG